MKFLFSVPAHGEAAGAPEERARVHHPPDPAHHGGHGGQGQAEPKQTQTTTTPSGILGGPEKIQQTQSRPPGFRD